MNRRTFLHSTSAAGAGIVLAPMHLKTSFNGFREPLNVLRGHLIESFEKSKILFDNRLMLHSPNIKGYRGLWPDDFLYPLLVIPELYDKNQYTAIAEFLTYSIVDMECFPDRIEDDGMPVMNPGGLSRPHAHRMPLHLPAAWIRLIDFLEQWGAEIPMKNEWALVFKKSIDKVSFSCGLTYVDPQRPHVGFGFHDPEAITGFELMSSMVLHFGLKRAARFFKGYIDETEIARWERLSDGIQANLYRLYDEEKGAYLAGSKDCRQVNVWGNGLAYWMVDDKTQERIVDFYRRNRNAIFLHGFTRQIAEPEGWQRHFFPSKVGNYTNGGFWSVGTGWVIPAIADRDPDMALEIVEELTRTLISKGFREYISAGGEGGGASGFLAAISLPLMGLISITEKRPFSDFF